MAKKKSNKDKKQPWSIPLRAREELYNGINPSADFGIGSFLSQGAGYLGGFRTGKGMSEDEARWAAYLGLPYDKEYAPYTKIRFEHDKDYPDRQYQGVSKRAKNEIREEVIPEAKRIKDKYGKEWIQVLDERGIFGNDSTIYHPRETYTGDLGKFGIREVGNSGIYEIGDKYDFPSWVPVPDRNEGTELMIRDTIWSDRANPKLYNKEIIKRKNKHSLGGWFKNTTSNLSNWNTNVTNSLMNSKFGQGLSNLGIKSGNIGGIANIGATAIGGLLAGKNKTGVGSAMQTVGSLASNIPGVGGMIGAGVNLVGGLVNAAFGSNINEEFVNQTEAQARQQSNYLSGATDTASLLSDWNALTFLGDVKKSDVGSDGWFSNKAGRETDRLNTLVDEANMRALASISNTAENIDKQNDLMLMANYSAYGGPINMKYTGTMSPFGNQFKDGGISIKPSKRGTFTAAAKKRGMGVQEFASKVLANKEDYSSAMVKKANFARNASKWKHADGGPLEEENLSLEDFITQKINEKRAAALDKSRNRTSIRVPMIPSQISEDSWRKMKIFDYNYTQNSIDKAIREQRYDDAEKLRTLLEKLESEYLNLTGYNKMIPGPNCIYNASDCYGLNEASNVEFADKANKLGFKKINILDAEPGDLVQDVDKGKPVHAMIYDSKNENGKMLFNYARGETDKDKAYDMKENYRIKSAFPIKDLIAYKYIGTPADSTQWINEYKERYNKKADGGNLFTNGVTFINNGDTHENNPLEGVRIGVDENNIPNLVEEGEVIFNDYVFSNRLRVPKAIRHKYKLRGVTFADAAKQLQKESEERPNDPISKNGLNALMQMLMNEQEKVRMKKESNKYAKGGKLGRVYDGTGGDPNWLYKPVTPGFIPSKDDILAEMEAMYPSLLGESTLPIASKIEGSTAFEKEQSSKVAPMKTNWLRYAPIVGSGLAVANDLFGGNEPDYTNADMFARAIEGTNRPIRARQIGNYLTYRPLDRDYYINKLNANTAASRRGIVNTSGGNRAAAMAGLLATDYNYGNQLGALARQAEEYNLAQRQAVEEFNRGTNMTNAEMAMKADMANAEQAMQRARMYGSLAEYRDKILAANRAEKAANLTSFIQGLGDLGTELTDKDKLRWLAELGVLKYDASGKYTGDKKSNVEAKGGRINRKKRGGFTI